MTLPFKFSAHQPVVGELAVMNHGDIAVRISPIGMSRANVDIRLRGHARVTDAVRTLEITQIIPLSDTRRIAEVLDQLEGITYREDLCTFDVFYVIDELLYLA